MDLYLSTPHTGHGKEEDWRGRCVLESFCYARNDSGFARYYPTADKFLLDSGAFTFMASGRKKDAKEWIAFTDAYIEFINKHDIKLFFEMDIDAVTDLRFVEMLRARIERGTGKKPIPVWHISRGKEYFVKMCEEYPYVAFGGLVADGKNRKDLEKAFPWFIKTAHDHGAKIHALGYTSLAGLQKYRFDSVDSSSWVQECRFASLSKFDPATGLTTKHKCGERDGVKKKCLSYYGLQKINWRTWCEIQDWYRRNR